MTTGSTAAEFHVVGAYGYLARLLGRLPGGEVEAAAVQRAFDLAPVQQQLTHVERRLGVGALIAQRVVGAPWTVDNHNVAASDDKRPHLAGLYVAGATHGLAESSWRPGRIHVGH
jgi:hypothetical protein